MPVRNSPVTPPATISGALGAAAILEATTRPIVPARAAWAPINWRRELRPSHPAADPTPGPPVSPSATESVWQHSAGTRRTRCRRWPVAGEAGGSDKLRFSRRCRQRLERLFAQQATAGVHLHMHMHTTHAHAQHMHMTTSTCTCTARACACACTRTACHVMCMCMSIRHVRRHILHPCRELPFSHAPLSGLRRAA